MPTDRPPPNRRRRRIVLRFHAISAVKTPSVGKISGFPSVGCWLKKRDPKNEFSGFRYPDPLPTCATRAGVRPRAHGREYPEGTLRPEQ
eukprot:6690315-Prymnesium_polylepis.1